MTRQVQDRHVEPLRQEVPDSRIPPKVEDPRASFEVEPIRADLHSAVSGRLLHDANEGVEGAESSIAESHRPAILRPSACSVKLLPLRD
jgi:hypothetical protein